MAGVNQSICLTLPKSITQQVSTCANSEQYITNFLQSALPSTDTNSIANELRKSLIFAKHKSKWNRKRRCRGKLLTSRKRMQLGLRKIATGANNGGMKYVDLLPLNQLWLSYIRQVVGTKDSHLNIPRDPTDPNWESVNQQLMKADFHGAKVSVVGSKCPSLIGSSGIVIQDTKSTFKICTEDNIIKTIPKDVVIMNIHLDDKLKLEFFGKDISIRPIERTVKKFKCGKVYEL